MRRKVCLRLRSLWWRMKEIDCVPYTNQVSGEMHAHVIAYLMFCSVELKSNLMVDVWIMYFEWIHPFTGELLCTNGSPADCVLYGDICKISFECKENSLSWFLCCSVCQVGCRCQEKSCKSASTEQQCDRKRSRNSLTKSSAVWKHHNNIPQTQLFYLKAVFSLSIYILFFLITIKPLTKTA